MGGVHEHWFPEEMEPTGRLILAPCLVCDLPALDAIAGAKRELVSLTAALDQLQAKVDELCA